jgi:hypothetical protein
MSKSKQEIRAEQVAVSDDALQEAGSWLKPGAWVAIICADPIYYGRIAAITPSYYLLEDASWIADAGRLHSFVADPANCVEAEYLGDFAVERPVVGISRILKGGTIATK